MFGPYVENLAKLAVTCYRDINSLMNEGNKARLASLVYRTTENFHFNDKS